MLCAPVFIFTSGSSALLGRPCCGLSIWLSLLAIFNNTFWVYAICLFVCLFVCLYVCLFRRHENTFVWYENGRQRFLGAQSINTEPTILCARSASRSREQNTKRRSRSENMWKVGLFYSQNNKISNKADTFSWEIDLFSLIVFLRCWLAG